MKMNVKPIPTQSERVNEIRSLTADIVNKEILPNERTLWAWRDDRRYTEADIEESKALRQRIQDKVREAGLWAPHLPAEYGGAELSFLEHAYMNEVLAYVQGGAALFGIVAPNSGNQTILVKYGTEEQKKKWLIPLIEGKMQS
ncbi:MAG: acyl-CoA dehydrogenase family protein, partial [Chloroflexi bacterium]|nr:acyl-CoA dehydrogenase family protein [Chloroflexota bacterium]